ncbi:hypothetical protein FXN63_14905 [Pigmentiphaga aceris]|uniref:Uncharacterized protein n=1 Tax=Pigmentiphaga aceris TaxID=1940612 RepID=A0A5C0AZF4_9BURK|nr:hypothetical protein FXN63_14905 [Pigmentiphaga aceris]
MTDPLTHTSQAGKPQPDAHSHDHGHSHSHAHAHAHAQTHAHDHAHDHGHGAQAGHVQHATHHVHVAPAPAAHMAWSVLSLSVFQRLLLVAPMLVCLWLAVVWAIAG